MTFSFRALWAAVCFGSLMVTCAVAPSVSQSSRQTTPVREAAMASDVIVTAAPAYEPLAALRGDERFPKGAQLLLIHAGKAEPLVPEFAASADASVSFDGGKVLFAGKKKRSGSMADFRAHSGRSQNPPGRCFFL